MMDPHRQEGRLLGHHCCVRVKQCYVQWSSSIAELLVELQRTSAKWELCQERMMTLTLRNK